MKQLLINEIQTKNTQTQKDSKQMEYELKINELTHSENVELKQKVKLKEDENKNLKQQLSEINEKLRNVEMKPSGASIEELNRKDELLKLYKNNFEHREKELIEEQRLLSSIIYDLGINNLIHGRFKPNGQS